MVLRKMFDAKDVRYRNNFDDREKGDIFELFAYSGDAGGCSPLNFDIKPSCRGAFEGTVVEKNSRFKNNYIATLI